MYWEDLKPANEMIRFGLFKDNLGSRGDDGLGEESHLRSSPRQETGRRETAALGNILGVEK